MQTTEGSTVRVIIKDLGGLAKREDLLSQQINVLVGSPQEINLLLTTKGSVLQTIRNNIALMREDQTFDMEDRQVRRQALIPREIAFMKFYNIHLDTQVDVAIVDGEQLLLRFNLNKLFQIETHAARIDEKKILLKYQPNFNLLVINSESFARREDRENGVITEKGDFMDDDDFEDSAKEREEKRLKILRRRNPFNNKLTDRDKAGFQPLHQDGIVSNLMNITLQNSSNGSVVLEGIIRQGNVFFIRSSAEELEKNEHKRREWNEKLTLYHNIMRTMLPYKDIEQDIMMDELLNEGQEGGIDQRAQRLLEQNANQGNFSYNEYDIQQIGFFEKRYKDNAHFILPNQELNNKIFLALSPSFVLDLFNYSSKKQVSFKKPFTQADLLKVLPFYIESMVSRGDVLFKYICKCMQEYARLRESFGTMSLRKSLEFMRYLLNTYHKNIVNIIETNDNLRRLYFTALSQMVFAFNGVVVEPKMEDDDEFYLQTAEMMAQREDFSEYVCRIMLLDTLIPDVPNLHLEFFNLLFSKKERLHRLSADFYLFYLNYPLIEKKEKIKTLQMLFNRETPFITSEMTVLMNIILTESNALSEISVEEVMKTVDALFAEEAKRDTTNPNTFMRFMRNQELCPLHRKVLSGFALTKLKPVQAYMNSNPGSYFVHLYNQIKEFLGGLKNDILIEFIGVKGILNDRKIELFEILHSGKQTTEPQIAVRTFIRGHIEKLNEMKTNIDTFVKVLTTNELYFNEYKFFNYHWTTTKDIQTKILTMTVQELAKHQCYTQSLVLLNVFEWQDYYVCQNYKLYYESLKSKCSEDTSLPKYYEAVLKTKAEFYKTLSGFADQKNYTLADYDKYLPRVTFDYCYKLYVDTMTALHIPTDQQKTILENSMYLHSLNKVLKIYQPMLDISAPGYLNLKKDKFTESIEYVYKQWFDKDKKKITVADVLKNDKPGIIKTGDFKTSMTYLMPMVLKDVAKSFDTYKFVKDTADEFIRSMREECDNENLDIVNKLDVINKNIKFLVTEKSWENIVKRFIAIPKDEQRKIKKYLRDLNSQIQSNVTHLAERTKKDQNYNQKIITQMLNKSTVNIKFNKHTKAFNVTISFEDTAAPFTIGTVEFEELLNKAKIISENANSQNAFNDIMKSFSVFGIELENMCENFSKLRQLGLIHNKLDLLIPFMNQSCQQQSYFQGAEDFDKLKFVYEGARGTLRLIQQTNHSLTHLEQTLSRELVSYYSPECYLMTYFYGKKLFFLTQYLRGKSTPAQTRETLALITESIPKNLVDFSFSRKIPDDLYKVFNVTYLNLCEWSENIKSKDKIKLNTSSVFNSKRIKTCTESDMNVYRTISQILYEAKESMVSLSQILFCKTDTSKNEIVSFCKRALLDPFKRLYFILSIDKLEYLRVMDMKNCLLKIIETKYDNLNFNMLIFNNQGKQTKNMFDNENFENINHSLRQLSTMVKDEEFQNAFANLFKTNTIVMSEQAGMGKTTYIKKDLNNRYPMHDLFFSGEMNKNTTKRRLRNLTDSCKDQLNFALTIKLDFIEDFDSTAEIIDYLLFCICIVRRYYTEIGCQDIREHLTLIYLEISNTFITEALSKLSFLDIMKSKEDLGEKGSKFKFRIILPKFSLENILYSTDSESNEQVVARFLSGIKNNIIGKQSLNQIANVSRDAYLSLLKDYYMADLLGEQKSLESRLKSTYAQYQFWLQSLARLAKEMNNVKDLEPKASKPDQEILRKEVALEILQFCSYIINVSVDQAKMSQDQMKEIMSELKKHNLQKQNLEAYQQKFSKITPWSSKSLIVPLIFGQKAFFAFKSLELIFNKQYIFELGEEKQFEEQKMDEDKVKALQLNKRFRERIKLRDYIRNSEQFITIHENVSNYSNECLTLLANFLGQSPSDVIERAKKFKGKGFVITLENFMKISLILLKSHLKIPIVMMGESGCGKTYLSEFVSECLIQDTMMELTLYSGVTEIDFINFMERACQEAKHLAEKGKNLWVFFDEFNTSSLQSIVAEIMIDRVCSIEPKIYKIPENMVFISCCNPFRMKTKKAEVGLVPKTSDTILSHRVYPIPERLLNYIWDFGQLSEADEKKHIISMVSAEKLFSSNEEQKEVKFVNLVYAAHKIVRNIEERSGVSLRDIKRVLLLYGWFRTKLDYLVGLGHKNFKKGEVHVRAAICAITVAYGLRLNGRYNEQEELFKQITSLCKDLASLHVLTKPEVKKTLAKLSDIYLDVLAKERIRVIPENIALNKPLKENFITMLACYDQKIPLIICGAPGTSKTLCTQIFDSAMIPNIIKSNKEFEGFKGIHSIYYGGSQTSTSEGISKVFYRAEQYLKQHGEDRPVVVFDEIGLAELSPYNPLKILHPLLEKPNQEVGFFGLSNWTLDLSKMNRLIYLARPDMAKDDLVEIFNISISGCKNDKAKKDLLTYLSLLADTYLDYREWQKSNGNHPNFHGSRDIYGVSKFVYNSIMMIANYDTQNLKQLIKKSIERNFNGAAYLFGKHENEIPFEKIEGLSDHKSKTGHNNVRIEDIGTPYGQPRHESLQILNIFSSSQVFKKIFMNKVAQKPEIADLFKTDFFEDDPVFDLIVANIQDKTSRFLLIKSEGEVVDNIFLERLSKLVKPDLLRDWRGIKGKENSHELLSTLKSYISLGFVVVMKNLDELYGSLYDLFNQKYSEVEGRKYCYLYFGENKHKVEVHPDFKAIILLDAESELQGLELELEQPAPFLNRFEKFFVRLANILTPEEVKQVYELVGELQHTIQGDLFKILGLSIDMLTSIILKCNKNSGMFTNLKKEVNKLVMRLATSNYLLSDNINDSQLDSFHSEHPYSTIWQLINDMKLKPFMKTCLFTFSNPIELEYIKKEINRSTNCSVLTSEELISQGLESRSEKMKRYENPFLVIQFTMIEHLSLITQLKTNINENTNIKRCLFVIHLDRRAKDIVPITKNIGLNFWHDWDNFVIENINGSNYSEMKDIYDLSLGDLVLSERHSMGLDIIKEASLSALQRIILEKNDENLKHNFQMIREMVQNDPENNFALMIVNKIRQSKLIQCEDKWRVLVVQNRKEKQSYSDIKSEILHVVNLKFGDIFKKYMGMLNEKLTNLATYSRRFYHKVPEIQSLYRQNLLNKIGSLELNKRSLESVKFSQVFYKLPFLKEEYETFVSGYAEKVIDENKEIFYKLAETETRFNEYSLSKNQDSRIIEELKNSVLNGESFIVNSIASLTSPLYDNIKKKFPLVYQQKELLDDLTFDLIFAVIRKWEEKTEKRSLASRTKGDTKSEHSKILNIMQTKYNFFKIIIEGMTKKEKQGIDVDSLLVVSAIISICYQTDMKYVFSLIEVSNIELMEFSKVVSDIGDKIKTPFKLNYEVFNHLIKNLQGKVIPDFKDEKINLKFLKNRYAEMISESMRNSNSKVSKNYDLKYMVILLDLLEILPYDESTKYLTEISQTKKEQDRLGGNFDISFVKKYIDKILIGIHLIPTRPNLDSLTLIVSEYVNTNAQSFNFNLFVGNTFDNLFSIFDERQQEKIASSLAHDISNNIYDFYSFEKLQSMLMLLQHNRALAYYDAFLSTIDTSKQRNMDILVSLIDKLYFNGLPKMEEISIQESVRIFEYLQSTCKFTVNHTGLENVIRYTMIRLTFNPGAMTSLLDDSSAIKRLDSLILPQSTSKEHFIDNPNSFPFIYFLQEMIVEAGDMSRYQLPYRGVTNICGIVMDEDASGSIVFFDQEIQAYYIDMNNKLSDYAYNGQLDKISELMKKSYKGSAKFNHYVVGVVLLNKFINPVSKEDEKVIQNVKNLFMKALDNVQISDLYKRLLFAIIRGDRFNFKQFLGDEISDPNYETRLKKVFYQFLLIAICFADEVGYDLTFWKKWCDRNFDDRSFKARIVCSDSIGNMCSIFENIVVERLSDGSYMDYGPQYVANLGIYKCSCEYVYSIGNCGYAMVTRPCPVCGKEIGGSNHHFVQRKGHEHIQTLEAFSALIGKHYDQGAGKYHPHTVVNKSCLETNPLKLRELGIPRIVDALKNRKGGNVMEIFQATLSLRHMFDHMLIISLPEILDSSDAKKFSDSLKALLPYHEKKFNEIMGRMAGRQIKNHSEYFLAHVKNDIETLSQQFNFKNPIQIFDYMRAILSTIAEKILAGKKMTSSDILVDEINITQAALLLPKQQEIADKIRDNELDMKSVFKAILFRNVKRGLMKGIFPRNGQQFEHIYRFMRHNDLNTKYIIDKFHQKLSAGSTNGLLKNIVNYQDILKDFPVMVDANVKIAQHFNLNYDRAYNFDEATELDIMKLDDPALKKLYAEFQRVWTEVIPMYEDKFPEVFSFAFMCQQNLNVKDFIDGVLSPKGAKLRKFLFIDPKEYSDVNLLYMSSIVRTFIDKFHNMIVNKINIVLKLDTSDERNVGKKNVEYCSHEDYVNYCSYEQHVLNNFWYETTTEGENNIHFDLSRIEYLCARDMKKPMINFDEKDIRYYNFKNTKLTEYEVNLQALIKKIRPIDLDPDTVKYFEELPESSIAKSYEFILEVSNYVLNNFLFNDERVTLKKIVLTKPEASLLRFSSYDETLHSKLLLGHLRDLYRMLKNLLFDWEVNNNREKYNVDLSDLQAEAVVKFCNDEIGITGEDVSRVKEEIRSIILNNYHQGQAFLTSPLEIFGLDISDLTPSAELCEAFGSLRGEQYLRVLDILHQGIQLKTRKSYVKKRSSIISE